MKGVPGSMKLLLILTGYVFFFGIQSASAVDVNIKITGEIYTPPCNINNGADINVDFGEMSLHDVNGVNNSVVKVVDVMCDYYQGTPYIRIDGTVLPGAADNVLKTTGVNASILGIALYQGEGVNASLPLKIGAGEQGIYGYKITHGLAVQNTASTRFTFTSVPYKLNSSEKLNAGEFSATATMSIAYL
ncbi:minor pilin subunit PapF [Escherichia coli]|uniref:fimbrial protein n=1 Tax=Escherichia coli TaxID=562 RepID=UPI0019B1E354|nr:fimbrial protein [Escherichia coli]CAD6177158.1 minor pilin subunit PapF [Escherichia coli]